MRKIGEMRFCVAVFKRIIEITFVRIYFIGFQVIAVKVLHFKIDQ